MIFIYTGGSLPQGGNFYIVAKDGIYLSKDTGLIKAVVKVKGIPSLKPIQASAKINLPKIPVETMAKAVMFFRRVYDQHKTESVLLIYYSESENKYRLEAPIQETSYVSASYKGLSLLAEGYKNVGSIHSHCDFEAFHSGTDRHDENNFDGIHITLGHIDQPYFTIDSELTVNGNPFRLDPEDFVEDIIKVEHTPLPKGFKRIRSLGVVGRMEEKVNNFLDKVDYAIFGESVMADDDHRGIHFIRPFEQYYDLVMEAGKDYRNYPPPISWMEKVKPLSRREQKLKEHETNEMGRRFGYEKD